MATWMKLNIHCGCAQEVKGHKKGRSVLEVMKENAVAETPAVGLCARDVPFTPALPATLMRVPKLGEVFYSQKGEIPSVAHLYASTPECCTYEQQLSLGHEKLTVVTSSLHANSLSCGGHSYL